MGWYMSARSTSKACYALKASTGATLWSYRTGDCADPRPPWRMGWCISVAYDDNVYALNASTGALLWSYTTGEQVVSSPAVANGVVYVGSDDNNVYALNATTGALLWSYTTGGGPSLFLARRGEWGGLCRREDDNVYALNASTGAPLWSYATGNSVQSSPAVANGVVYVGSNDDNVYALNASTGALLWSYTTGGRVYSSPAVANGVVYVGCERPQRVRAERQHRRPAVELHHSASGVFLARRGEWGGLCRLGSDEQATCTR